MESRVGPLALQSVYHLEVEVEIGPTASKGIVAGSESLSAETAASAVLTSGGLLLNIVPPCFELSRLSSGVKLFS